jgi:NADH dehydrogenase/NADH:ubiquinone oxidoreductase subunit G
VQINSGIGVSCSISIADNMIIYTNNKRVNEARESVLEFLLINHPLDCPICDQGGECDLQDISLIFGSDRGRFYEAKKKGC